MRHELISISCLALCAVTVRITAGDNGRRGSAGGQLPPVETLLVEPIELESVSIWVPAAQAGPEINWSCTSRTGYCRSAELAAGVRHLKGKSCPKEAARLLAEYSACYPQESLPLTTLAGWQWEYSYSPCQYDLVFFDLRKRGGCWEGSWEAILTQSTATISIQWAHVSDADHCATGPDDQGCRSQIEIRNFSSMRLRDGYPKKRQIIR